MEAQLDRFLVDVVNHRVRRPKNCNNADEDMRLKGWTEDLSHLADTWDYNTHASHALGPEREGRRNVIVRRADLRELVKMSPVTTVNVDTFIGTLTQTIEQQLHQRPFQLETQVALKYKIAGDELLFHKNHRILVDTYVEHVGGYGYNAQGTSPTSFYIPVLEIIAGSATLPWNLLERLMREHLVQGARLHNAVVIKIFVDVGN
ncbi:hypothetical protein E8E12_008849 [Didymella heteroderae]|uniref:Uncharacterized protein n=1 Tax=Didymella heteroderae TaxID=1769908 RepID=A0A9P4WT32_9PLEO|nr:hypothetical protein E8E12_008849 [Didymella heteroderae]